MCLGKGSKKIKKNLENSIKGSYIQAGLVFSRASSDIGSLLDDPPWRGPMIRLLSPIGGKSNELNSCHNTLYFCGLSTVLCLLSIELLSGIGSMSQLSALGD